jgi:membrane-bound lytic murein transglycosylase D
MLNLKAKTAQFMASKWHKNGPSLLLSLLLALTPLLANAQSGELFPRPPELEDAVNFWVRVYTEVDTNSGFLHDSRHLSVIYERLPLDRREIEATRNRIREDLRVLATGKRSGLTASQQEILALWPADVSNETLRTAASNVRWQLGQSNRFLAGLRRSGAYREHINRVIEEKNLPPELVVLPHVESSWNPNAYSSASAAGMWQFGRATGLRFMRIDHIVDERMDPYIAANAAMSLLEYNYSVLKTWPLALTAYNHGAGGIARAVRETGTRDIETIVANYRGRAFGFASRNFYAQFLAVLEVEERAEEFFGPVRFDPAPEFVEVRPDAFIDAEIFARSLGMSLEQLRADNPALRPVVWEGNKRIPRGFPIKVRREFAGSGDLLAQIPADYKFAVQTPDIAYVVERGDSLSVIARRFNTSVSELVSLNQLASRNRIQIGQRLLLPQDNANSQQLASSPEEALEDGVYRVRRGDTVSLIAARYNIPENQLLGLNGIADRNRIYPGQELRLPGVGDEGRQLAVIDGNMRPTPPTQLQYAGEEAAAEISGSAGGEGDSENDEPPAQVASQEPQLAQAEPAAAEAEPQSRDESSAPGQLALADDLQAPAVVMPAGDEAIEEISEESGELDSEILADSAADNEAVDSEAVAMEPQLSIAQSNEQLSELLSADPSDYSVASDNSIEIQASETLGHYADWLGIRAWDLRRLNGMAYRDPVIIGERLKLDFSQVNIDEFEVRRRDYHSTQQQEFFSRYRIQDVETYQVRRGDNLGSIARSRYSTPIWLLRQYNPSLDFNRVQIGQEVVFPLLEPAED